MSRRKDRWKKANKAYSLSGPDSPLSPHAIQSSNQDDLPVCCTTYGSFSDSILEWIDHQPNPSLELEESTLEFWRMVYSSIPRKKESEQAKFLRKERGEIVAARRSRFDQNRDQLMLAMLHAGNAYICAHASCGEMRHLHVDHVVPLSKGGGDELSNLQFLCATHNLQKGAKYQNS